MDNIFAQLVEPVEAPSDLWGFPASDFLSYETPLDAIMSDGLPFESFYMGAHDPCIFELGGQGNLNALTSYENNLVGDVSGLLEYYTEVATFSDYSFA